MESPPTFRQPQGEGAGAAGLPLLRRRPRLSIPEKPPSLVRRASNVMKSPWFLAGISFIVAVAALVASLHHHVRQAPAHHAAPPAHKAHTVPVEHSYVTQHETGMVEFDKIDPGLKSGSVLKKWVKFGQPFRKTPSILLSPSFVTYNNVGEAWAYGVHQPDTNGFWIYLQMWGSPAFHTYQLHFIAVGK